MPTYDLVCECCGHKWDVNQAIADPLPKSCPECKKRKVKRAWSKAPAFHSRYSPMHPRVNRGRGH